MCSTGSNGADQRMKRKLFLNVLSFYSINTKGVSRKFQGCFKEVSRVFQGSFKDVSRKLKRVSRKFHGCFKEVSRAFHGSFKEACFS